MVENKNWSGKKILIIGAARQGIALARYFSGKGAFVVLNDQRLESELVNAREKLASLNIEWVLGGHPVEILNKADLVCPSAGIPLELPIISEARRQGIPLSNDSQIFLEIAPCPVVGITGSAGKTTTTTLVGNMAEAYARVENEPDNIIGFKHKLNRHYRKFWVGGNIGNPLLSVADEMMDNDLAIMELSSFQLEVMSRSPQMAVVLNLTPNHLDRHGTMDAYIDAKARILEYQKFDDTAVLGRDDSRAWDLHKRVRGRLVTFGRERFDLNKDYSNNKSGLHPAIDVYLDGKDILLNSDNIEEYIVSCKDISLRGAHNVLNVAAACAIAAAAGIPSGAMREGIRNFRGVPHRLEFVRSWRGAEWYNDSIATAPERAIAGIQAFDDPIVLMAGGRDKNLAWDEFVNLICQRVDHLITFGDIAEMISEKVQRIRSDRPHTISVCKDLKIAVRNASQVASRGDVVLFSPGGTSFDEFSNFEDRGDRFKQWVMALK